LSTGSGFRFITYASSATGGTPPIPRPGSYTRQFVTDMNGDGVDDFVVVTGQGAWWVGTADGAGHRFSFGQLGSLAAAQRQDLYVGDFNGDGKRDLLVMARNDTGTGTAPVFDLQLSVGLSDGAHLSMASWHYDPREGGLFERGGRFFIGDFNGDGR